MRNEGITGFINSPLFLITLTVAVYWGAVWLYRKVKTPLLHPLLVSMAVIISFLKLAGVEYQAYYEANGVVNFFLGLSVVSLGYLLYENLSNIRGREWPILASVFTGAVTGVVAVVGMAMMFGTGREIIASLQPKSVTMPIAIMLSEGSGGIPALTSVAVVLTGILGSVLGPWLFSLFRITDPVARGLALGSASHAVGTARAMEMGAVEGAVGGVAMGIMGLMTAVIIPLIEKIIF